MIDKVMFRKTGDDAMKSDRAQLRLSNVGVALLVICLAAGFGVTALSSPERVTKDTLRDLSPPLQTDPGKCGALHSTRLAATPAATRR